MVDGCSEAGVRGRALGESALFRAGCGEPEPVTGMLGRGRGRPCPGEIGEVGRTGEAESGLPVASLAGPLSAGCAAVPDVRTSMYEELAVPVSLRVWSLSAGVIAGL